MTVSCRVVANTNTNAYTNTTVCTTTTTTTTTTIERKTSLKEKTKQDDFRVTLIRTLRYHYFLKVYLPMYRLVYAKQLAKFEGHNKKQCRLVYKRSKLAGGKVVGGIAAAEGGKRNGGGRKVVVRQNRRNLRCLVLDRNMERDRKDRNCNRMIRCQRNESRTDAMNNKVVHFESHATVTHLGPEEDSGGLNDNWMYNNSQYLRASHPLDNINLNEDDSSDSSDDDDDDNDESEQCRCYIPQCTRICTDPQCTHAHAQLGRRLIHLPCSNQSDKQTNDDTNDVTTNGQTDKQTNCICRPGLQPKKTSKDSPPIPGRGHSHECIMFQSRRTDREEIRRKLAMGGDEDYYGGERAYKKPNLQTRLQHAMNLQICFMNPDTPATAAPAPGEAPAAAPADSAAPTQPAPVIGQGKEAPAQPKPEEMEDEDFFAKQQRLQAEATMALAQVRPMAHMQLEIEKQNRKKSPIAEIIQTAIPGFSDGRKKKLAPKVLLDMNVAQLQVVVNDLHSQIEALNEELVLMLVERDDLHMQQDSMLVNSEDLLARAQEFSLKVQPPKKKKEKKK